MKNLYLVLCTIVLVGIHSSCVEEHQSHSSKSIFTMSEEEIKSFQGKSVGEFFVSIQENYDAWVWLKEEDINPSLGRFVSFRKDDTLTVEIVLDVDSLRYQSAISKDGEWNKEKFKKEKISRVLVLVRRLSNSCAD